ncbi:MAG TPA: hypothetical protein VIG33_03230 [Pseudobdellovibrionaceae bacterium]|jgi:hypothetical protein
MLRIINLLQEKNHYLEKFYALNETEIVNFSLGNFENLENFYNTRERILEIIKYIDECLNQTDLSTREVEEIHQVKLALRTKDEYVSRIIEQDLEVLACIEAAKSNIIRELQDVRRVRKAVGGYKMPSFINRLDEEA